MLFDVVERVLCDVGVAEVRVALDLAGRWLELGRKELDHGRLACAVGADDGDAHFR